jgi:hypothetical protein
MRTLSLFAATAAVALSQQTTQTHQFTHLQTPPEFAEAATVIRSIVEIRDLTVNAEDRTMTLQGDAVQAELANWLFSKLDRPAGTMRTPDAAQLDYRPTRGRDDMVRVCYFKNPVAVGAIQEMSTVIRSLTEIRRALVSNAAGAFVVRGTQEQIDAARWLLDALDQPSFSIAWNQYRITDAEGEDTIGLFSVSKFRSEQELQNFAAELRMAIRMKRVFTYYPLRVIAVRSTPAQIELAARLVNKP